MTENIDGINPEDYLRDELLDLAKIHDIVEFPDASNPSKPNKAEIYAAIKKKTKSNKNTKGKKNKKKQLEEELLQLKRVVITEVHKPATFENDDSNRVEFVTWGNRIIGHKTNRVIYGRPWILPVGCINNLKEVTYTPVFNKGNVAAYGQPMPAYRIEELDLPTESELENIKTVQKLREVKGV